MFIEVPQERTPKTSDVARFRSFAPRRWMEFSLHEIFPGQKAMAKHPLPGYKAPTDARLALEPKMEEVKAESAEYPIPGS